MYSLKNISKPIVFIPMAADIFHHGHVNVLLKAKKYGNIVIGLMTDSGIKKYKKKYPIIKFKNRKKILEQIKHIKKIIPINGLEYLKFAKFYKFDYFIHGDDWKKNIQSNVRKELIILMKKWGGKVVEFSYTKNISSSIIKKKIKYDK